MDTATPQRVESLCFCRVGRPCLAHPEAIVSLPHQGATISRPTLCWSRGSKRQEIRPLYLIELGLNAGTLFRFGQGGW